MDGLDKHRRLEETSKRQTERSTQTMDYGKILKRAWDLVKSYRALWVLGAILALTSFSVATPVFWGLDNQDEGDRQGIVVTRETGESFLSAFQRAVEEEIDELEIEINTANQDIEEFFAKELHVEIESDLLAIIIVLAGLLLIGFVVAKVAGYVANTALIRMADDAEDSGAQYSARQGLRMGWSRAARRLFLIDLLVDTSAVLAVILLFALVLSPLALWATGSTGAGVVGTVLTVSLFFPVLALVIVGGAALSMLKQFMQRACVLEDLGVTAAIRHGYSMARGHLRKVAPMWLITVGVGVTWPILMIPVVVVALGAGVVLGGLTALLTGGVASLFQDGAMIWVAAVAVGIPVLILTVAAPLVFLGGIREAFLSSTWTLTYRELRALESVKRPAAPDVGTSSLEVAATI
jgi:hypothetical protein